MSQTLLIRSRIMDFSRPLVMGIVNVTPDSFACRCASMDEPGVMAVAGALVQQGADILDIGACSTRPDSEPVSADEEWRRLDMALGCIKKAFPDSILSVDTFRAEIAERAIKKYEADIINDVSGLSDEGMLPLLSRARVPYILTHPAGACARWDEQTDVMSDMLAFFSFRLDELHRAGVKDVILDPGLGFGKTLEQNYHILMHLNQLDVLDCPVMVGLSRKSMIYNALNTDPMHALNGTTAAHVVALMQGASVLRVHDVREAKEVIRIVDYCTKNKE